MSKRNLVSAHAGYLKGGFDISATVRAGRKELRGVTYDLLVCTGISGALVAPVLGYSLRKPIAIVRKKGVTSHSSRLVEGRYPRSRCRWVFVDDQIDTGTTRRRVIEAMDEWYEHLNEWVCPEVAEPKYAGTLLYANGEVKFHART